MRAVRLTKEEAKFLRALLGEEGYRWSLKDCYVASRLLAKLDAAEKPVGPSVNPGPLEEVLVASSRGKVVPLGEGQGYARASKQATAVGATVEDAKLVGEWMARQGWLRGPQTLIDCLNKWPQWLAKARATEPPPSLKEGLGEAGRGTVQPGEGAPAGRPPRGFR